MSTPALHIAQLLASDGIGQIGAPSGWSINVSREPTAPPTAITVYDTGGADPVPTIAADEPTVQVRVRHPQYAQAYAKAQQIKTLLLGHGDFTKNATLYQSVWMVGDINPIGRDANDRVLLTMNFRMLTRPQAAGHRT